MTEKDKVEVLLKHIEHLRKKSAWLQSRGHRANLLNRGLTEIGVGCAVGRNAGYTVLWVQDFGRPRQSGSATLLRP